MTLHTQVANDERRLRARIERERVGYPASVPAIATITAVRTAMDIGIISSSTRSAELASLFFMDGPFTFSPECRVPAGDWGTIRFR